MNNSFKQKNILVIGDTILDEYIYIHPKKISDEAHVITSEIVDKRYSLGGASNVARNITSQGHNCTYVGLSSKETQSHLKNELTLNNINYKLFNAINSIQIKTRIMSTRGGQICRFDTKIDPKIDMDPIMVNIISFIEKNIKKFDFIVISKYFDFFLNKKLVSSIIKVANSNKVKIIVDNRQSNIEWFKNANFYKVNFNEFCSLFPNKKIENSYDSIKKIMLSSKLPVDNIILTRSELPTIIYNTKTKKINEYKVEEVKVSDVSGAGDTFVATFSVEYDDKKHTSEIVDSCHKICNIVVRKFGTDVAWLYEFSNNVELSKVSDQLKKNQKKIVFTNGVFDILHEGHIKLLEEAKKLGDFLIVGLNSDSSVKKLKGPTRPIKNQDERKKILETLKCVDKVIIFNELTVDKILKELKPDVYVKGGDYNKNNIPEKNSLKYVNTIHFVKIVDGKSSTKFINKIKG